jgi:hypothetical protein
LLAAFTRSGLGKGEKAKKKRTKVYRDILALLLMALDLREKYLGWCTEIL